MVRTTDMVYVKDVNNIIKNPIYMNKLKDYLSLDRRFLVGIDAHVYADSIKSGEGAKSLPERARSEFGEHLKYWSETDPEDLAVIELNLEDQTLLQFAYVKYIVLNDKAS